MKSFRGIPEGMIIARYRKGQFTITCRVIGKFYCVTFHNGRQSALTHYSTDKAEMNQYVLEAIRDGYRKEINL